METEVLEMSKKERDRLTVLRQVQDGLITQLHAASLLKITDRQVINLLKRVKIEGDRGVFSKNEGS